MFINQIYRLLFYGYKRNSSSFIKHLRKKGISIGEGTTFFSPESIFIDTQYPCLIKIGNNVKITAGVRMLTHDFSWSVLKRNYGYVLGSSGKIHIGDGTFVGNDVILLKNSIIGSNCIIGAGSLVAGKIPDNSVAIGRPAKVVMRIDEFFEKRLSLQLEEAYTLFVESYKLKNVIPNQELFYEYFQLFSNIDDIYNNPIFKKQFECEKSNETIGLEKNLQKFPNYNEFCDYCLNRMKSKGENI